MVAVLLREPRWKRPFAFGADATRRINRVAFAPMALGDSGPVRECGGGVGDANDICDACAVSGGARDLRLSGFALFPCRAFSSSSIVPMPSPGCCEEYEGVLGVRRDDEFLDGRLLESVESDEWYEDRWSMELGPRVELAVKGVRVADVASAASALVSRVSEEAFAGFLLGWLPSRSSDFQPDELALGSDGELGAVAFPECVVWCGSAWPLGCGDETGMVGGRSVLQWDY